MRGKHQWVRLRTELLLVLLLGVLIATSLGQKSETTVIDEDVVVQTYNTKWTDAESVDHEVNTTRNEGESNQDFLNRHTAAVDALKAVYPPV